MEETQKNEGADASKTELFEKAPIPKAVMKLAIPTILSSLVMVIYSMADTYFVGLLNDAVQTAAVALAAPVLLAFNAVNNLFGVGTSSMMSRAMGKKDFGTMERCCAVGFYLALFSGLFVSLVYTAFHTPILNLLGAESDTVSATGRYLMWTTSLGAAPAIMNVVMAYLVRSEGAALHASIGTMSGCVLNIILDPVFIMPWGLDMGAAGAGCATFISNCTACAYFLILIAAKRKKSHVCIDPRKFRPKKDLVFGICGVGIPAAIQNLLNVTGMIILDNFMSSYGADAVAAMGIVQKVNMIPLYIALGLGQGIMPLIGYNYSSGNVDRMKKAVRFALIADEIFLVAITIVYHVFSEGLVSFFIDEETVIAYGSAFLKGMCLAIPFYALDFLAVGIFQACGMGKKSLIFALLRKVVLEIPALIVLNILFPMYGLAYAQPFAEFVMAILAAVVLLRMFSKLDRNMNKEEKPEVQRGN